MPEQEAPPTRRAPHMERYVRVRPFPTEETEDSHKLELVIDNQGFLLSDGASNCHESREAAEWSRDMLCIALNELRSQVIDECVKAIDDQFSEKRGGDDPSGARVSGEVWEAYYTAAHRAIAAISKLKIRT